MNFNIKNIIAVALISTIAIGCKKKENTSTTTDAGKGVVHLEFFSMAGNSALNLNNQYYKNENGDSFLVTKFDYYISNITFNGTDSSFKESESYHLLKTSDASTRLIDISSVPAGSYNSITLTIGVDSTRNVSGDQVGALDPANGMFWSWTSGYIMMKFEGTSPQSGNATKDVQLHTGGFSGQYNVLKTVTLSLPNTLVVNKNDTTHVHITANVLQLFKTPNTISFATTNIIHMPGADAKKIADNYADMFEVIEVGHE